MHRLDRVTAILVQLQAKRKVSGAALAEQFGVSLRPRERVVLRFQPLNLLPALVQHLHDTKYQYG